MKISETCACGASFGIEAGPKSIHYVIQWREQHSCPDRPEPDGGVGAGAQVEMAPQYVPPEMHIGFRPNYYDEDE